MEKAIINGNHAGRKTFDNYDKKRGKGSFKIFLYDAMKRLRP